MSSTLRLSIIMVLLLSTTALGVVAYNSMNKVPEPSLEKTSATSTQVLSDGYFVAKKPQRVGTLAKEEDFDFITPLPPDKKDLPPETITGSRDKVIARLRGSLVRRFLDTKSPVTSNHILSPHDRGFLASVLEAGKRAVSIEVDEESGVSRLIWPGDHVDVVLTHEIDKDKPLTTMSETILQNVRIIAIDQDIEEGQSAPANNATANNAAPPKPPKHPVSLELKPEEVQKIAVAKKLGTLSLAIRPDEPLNAPAHAGTEARAGAPAHAGSEARAGAPASPSPVEQQDTGDTPRTTLSHEVSPGIAHQHHCERVTAIARENATVTVYGGGKVTQYLVKSAIDPVTRCLPLKEAPMGPATAGSVRIPANVVDGHFYPKVTINGTPVRMVADTGATLISLSEEDARKVGVDTQSLQFTDTVHTANGPKQVAPVTLPEVSIEGIVLRNLPAHCCVTSTTSLLGMSALGRLGLEIKDGWMILSPKS